jgi:Fe-S-cluster formation regulator IscX/YfhJ
MNYWEILIEALIDNIKDSDTRTTIYARMLESIVDISIVEVSEAMGEDDAFDAIAQEWLDENTDDEEAYGKDEFGMEYDDE